MKKIILFFFLLLLNSFILCSQNVSFGELHQNRNNYDDKCVKVYLHKVVEDSLDDIGEDELIAQIDLLNFHFSKGGNSGITFHLSETDGITTHNLNEIQNPENLIQEDGGLCLVGNFTEISGWSHTDGIDLYFFNVNLGGFSVANGIANESEAMISDIHRNSPTVAHEVGHILGLFHTYHGTIGGAMQSGVPVALANCENESVQHVNPCDPLHGGDFVEDTTIDEGIEYTINNSTCEAEYTNGGNTNFTCGNGFENIDLKNIMSNRATSTCADRFSPNQISRMKSFVEMMGVLSTDCPVDNNFDCNSCDRIIPDILNFESSFIFNDDCTELNVVYPQDYNDNVTCNNTSFIITTFNEDGSPLASSGQTSYPFAPFPLEIDSESSPTYAIEAFRDGVSCTTNEFTINCNNSNECDNNPCGMIADFTTNINDCDVNFDGTNNGVSCPDQTYTWTVNDQFVANTEDFNYTFPSTGNYNVSFTITNPNGGKGCSNTINQSVYVDCEPSSPPSCPTNLELYVLENCEDAQVYLNANAGVAYVDFYYTLGSYNHVYLGTTTGNSANQFAYPIYMPDPPSSGSWNGHVMSAYAVVFLDNGDGTTTECDEIVVRQRLSCSTGGPWWKSSINVHPNPAKPNSELQFEGINAKDIKSIELFDLFGNSKMRLKPNNNSFKVPQLQSGLYIVKFYTSKGIEQKKLIIE